MRGPRCRPATAGRRRPASAARRARRHLGARRPAADRRRHAPVPTEPLSRSLAPNRESLGAPRGEARRHRPAARGHARRPRKSRDRTGRSSGSPAAAVVVGAAVIVFGNPFGSPTPSASGAASGAASAAAYGDGTCPTSQPAALPAGESASSRSRRELGDIVIEVDGAAVADRRRQLRRARRVPLLRRRRLPSDGCAPGRDAFVIQGGDPDGTGRRPGPGYTIQDEPVDGDVQARHGRDGPLAGPDSQGSQFFIVLDDDAARRSLIQIAPTPTRSSARSISGHGRRRRDLRDAERRRTGEHGDSTRSR